jgi:class 3 adenylate cyclase
MTEESEVDGPEVEGPEVKGRDAEGPDTRGPVFEPPAERRTGRRLAAIVFADVAGYTELSSRDEDLALAVIELFQDMSRTAVNGQGGRVVKFLGDGMLAEFASLDAAVAASHALQAAFSSSVEVQEAGIALRVGVHLGDVVFSEDGDIHGSGVNVASRIEGHAPLSGIVVSDSAYRQLRNRRAYTFSSIGEHALKGVPDPMELYVVLLEGQQPPAPAVRVIKDRTPQSSGAGWSFLRWAFGLTLTVVIAAYAADFQGVRGATMQLATGLGISLGGDRVAVQPPVFVEVDGGAAVAGTLTLNFDGPIDPNTATSSTIEVIGPEETPVDFDVTVVTGNMAVNLQPVAPLAYGTQYRVILSSLLRSATGGTVELPDGASSIEERLAFTTQPRPAGAPTVLASDPTDGATGVRGSSPITVTFDQPMDAATFNTRTVTLLDDEGQPMEASIACCGEEGDRLELRSARALPGGAYTVRLGRGIADIDGELSPEVIFGFQVRGTSTPTSTPTTTPVETTPAPTGPGQLTVRITDSALAARTVVHLDGTPVGPPPLEDHTLSENVAHTVEIYATPEVPGGASLLVFRESVTLRPAQSSEIEATLTPFGTVSIISTPVGEVFIDGVAVGNTPLQRHLVTAGATHRLEVRPVGDDAATYGTYSVDFTVEPMENVGLGRVTLPPR